MTVTQFFAGLTLWHYLAIIALFVASFVYDGSRSWWSRFWKLESGKPNRPSLPPHFVAVGFGLALGCLAVWTGFVPPYLAGNPISTYALSMLSVAVFAGTVDSARQLFWRARYLQSDDYRDEQTGIRQDTDLAMEQQRQASTEQLASVASVIRRAIEMEERGRFEPNAMREEARRRAGHYLSPLESARIDEAFFDPASFTIDDGSRLETARFAKQHLTGDRRIAARSVSDLAALLEKHHRYEWEVLQLAKELRDRPEPAPKPRYRLKYNEEAMQTRIDDLFDAVTAETDLRTAWQGIRRDIQDMPGLPEQERKNRLAEVDAIFERQIQDLRERLKK